MLLLDEVSDAEGQAADASHPPSAETGIISANVFTLTPEMLAGIRFDVLTHCAHFRSAVWLACLALCLTGFI